MTKLRVTDEMARAALECDADLGTVGDAYWAAVDARGEDHELHIERVKIEAALQAGGFTEEHQCRDGIEEIWGWGNMGLYLRKRLVGPWREVVSDGE